MVYAELPLEVPVYGHSQAVVALHQEFWLRITWGVPVCESHVSVGPWEHPVVVPVTFKSIHTGKTHPSLYPITLSEYITSLLKSFSSAAKKKS